MEDVSSKISLYHNLFIACLVLALICLVIAGIVFFVCDIWNVFSYLTGRRAKKQIKELEEENAASGRLMRKERNNMQYVAQEMKEDMGVRGAVMPGARKVENVIELVEPSQSTQESTSLLQENVGMDAISLLQNNVGTDVTSLLQEEKNIEQETSLLSVSQQLVQKEESDDPQTTVLSEENLDDATATLKKGSAGIGTFKIEREIILIHAEEVI